MMDNGGPGSGKCPPHEADMEKRYEMGRGYNEGQNWPLP